MVNIDVRPEELARGYLDAERHEQAVRALRKDGIVVLGGVVSQASVDVLRDRALADVEALLNRPDRPFNWNVGNLQQDPAPFPPYLFRDVLVSDVVISVTKGVLGAGLKCGFYSGNTALPSEARQPVHADEGQLWPDLESAPPAHSLVVNIPLVDMGPENGSTEVWPGTHRDTSVTFQSGNIEVAEDRLAMQRALQPPLQPVVKAGGVVIRDMRMWHAGMPNRTATPRPMIAMIHSVAWWPTGRLRFASGSEEYLLHPDLKWQVEFTPEPIDHIASPGGHMAPP